VQIAVVNSSALPNVDVCFMVEAVAYQVIECAKFWGIAPMACSFYATVAGLPAADVHIIEIVDDLDQPGALGYHTDVAGVEYGRVLAQGAATSITLSHEALELLCDPTCDQWRPRGDGTQVALEVCDPVEGDSYGVVTTVLGEDRTVDLSNYVLPAWFKPGATGVAVDRMHTAPGPFTMTPGGYQVIIDTDGSEQDVFARLRYGSLAGIATAGKRLAVRNSRLLTRLRCRR
jgi:hypothetical protein